MRRSTNWDLEYLNRAHMSMAEWSAWMHQHGHWVTDLTAVEDAHRLHLIWSCLDDETGPFVVKMCAPKQVNGRTNLTRRALAYWRQVARRYDVLSPDVRRTPV